MTWTSAVGQSSKWLLYKIVHGLALTRISPNALTFIGLLINVVAGFLFGYANAENQRRMFVYAGLVIIGAGIFDMVDGRVARATNQVTQFGGFFDSVIDRYSDDWSELAYLLIQGTAALIPLGEPEHSHAIALLRERYVQYLTMPIEQHPVIAIRPAKVVAWGLGTRD